VPTHVLALTVNDTAMGSVSGAGIYDEGTMVTVTATPNDGYRFVQWSDDVTAATRLVKMDYDISLTAYFEPIPTYTVTLHRVLSDGGNLPDECVVSGEGTYLDGDSVTVSAASYGNYITLLYWLSNDGEVVSQDNPYTFVIHSDVELTAYYERGGGIGDVEGSVFSLYPNPASTTVTVETDRPATMTLMDVSGRQCGEWRLEGGTNTLDISTLPKGVYFVRLDTGGAVRKLIVR
jgi:hypothetical protein